ncbi:hypothetical protein E2P81_ATG11833 [Venturia nashicola]|uniref:Sterol-4-alpha-carboxylate 3-dehydrogenase ERG26, decarboxylating n=1 Tax=Venturia nashicola TaxID=86259 RepID=A0A4Z1P5Z4_9PEZI|nr:hypothetical protein E6O75_ATG11523 [Venturia nashicola]TLD24497.1 hypothetical protein E2P81_ATG11833 [Venturia nashicola]
MSNQDDLGHVIVIGGCGFVGHHIVSLLLSRHPKTIVSTLDLRTSRNRIANPNAFYYDCDITDLAALQQLFAKLKPNAVIHTASPVAFGIPPSVMLKVNVDGTNNLLRAAQDVGVKAFVFTSSASVIMDAENDLVNADERWPVITGKAQPEYYTHTKGLAELAVLKANRSTDGFLTCAIRPAGIFGPGDVQMLPGLLQASRKGQSKFQLGPNTNLFDFTYVENIAHGHLLALVGLLHTSKLTTTPLDHERIDGEAFFITNDSPVYFWDMARRVWKEAGDQNALNPAAIWVLGTQFALTIATIMEWVMWIFGKVPNLNRTKVRYSVMTRYYSVDKAKMRLGYTPIVELEEGIRRGVKAMLENEAQQQKSLSEKKGQ